MEVHAIDTLSGREEPLEIDADATVSTMKRQCGEAFGFGEDVELSVSGQRVACDGAERVSNVAAFSGGCRVGVVRGVAEFVAQLRSGAVKMDDIPVWARQRRECVLAMLVYALKDEHHTYVRVFLPVIQAHWVHPSLHDDKEVMLQYLKYDPKAFLRASAALRSDADVVIVALQQDASMWHHVEDKSLQDQRDVALLAVPHCANSAVWLSDKAFVLEALVKDKVSPVWPHVSKALKQDKEVAMKALLENKVYFGHLSEALRGDKDFVMEALEMENVHFSDVSGALKQDKEVVMEAIRCRNLGGFHQLSVALQQDKEVAIEALCQQNVNFSDLSGALREDREVVMKALAGGSDAGVTNFHQLSATFREDKEVVMEALRENVVKFGALSEALRDDKEFVMEALASNVPVCIGDLSEALQEDAGVLFARQRLADNQAGYRIKSIHQLTLSDLEKDVAFKGLCTGVVNLGDLSEALRGDKDFIIRHLHSSRGGNMMDISDLSEGLRGDKEVILEAFDWEAGGVFHTLSPTLQQDKDVVMNGFGTCINFLQLNATLQEDKDVVMEALEPFHKDIATELEFSDLSEAMRGDKDVVLKALECDRLTNFHQMSATLQEDKELVMEALDYGKLRNFHELSATLQEDKDVVMEALHGRKVRLGILSEALQADRTFVMQAIATDPVIYLSLTAPLRHDKDVALAAIAACSSLFVWMAPALRDNLDVALAAIREHPSNFVYAGDRVRADKQAALAAFCDGHHTDVLLPFASAGLQADREVVLAAVRANAKNREYASPALQDLPASGP